MRGAWTTSAATPWATRTRASRSLARARRPARASATASACRAALRRGGAKGARGWRISAGGRGCFRETAGTAVRLVRRARRGRRHRGRRGKYGPRDPPESGIVMIGATPWVCNYNVPVGATPPRKRRARARVGGRRPGRRTRGHPRGHDVARRARGRQIAEAPEPSAAGGASACRPWRCLTAGTSTASSSGHLQPPRRDADRAEGGAGGRSRVCVRRRARRRLRVPLGCPRRVRHQPHAGTILERLAE